MSSSYKKILEQRRKKDDVVHDPKREVQKKPSITFTDTNISNLDICNGEVVKLGMKGDIVWWIQNALQVENPNVVIDEKFGNDTKKEVANFQLKNKEKLKVNGEVDKDTWDLLYRGTKYACPTQSTKPEEKIDDKKMEKIDNKKTETPLPTKHPLKPVRGRIGEQTTPLYTPKGLGGKVETPDSLKSNDKPQVETPKVKVDTPSEKLKRAKFAKNENGVTCLDEMVKKLNLKPNPSYGESEIDLDNGSPAYAFVGTNPQTNQEEDVYFTVTQDGKNLQFIYASGYVVTATSSACLKRKPSYLTDEQQKFVEYNVTEKSGYKVTIEPGQEQYYDGPIDITKIFAGAKDYFSPNTFFVYKRKGFGVEERNNEYYQQIEELLNKVGWTYKKPDISTDAYNTKVDIRKQFPKYTELFPDGLYIYFTGNTRSTPQRTIVTNLMADIERSVDTPDGKTCRDAINVLYDAKEAYNKNIVYFSGDTELEQVREYIKRCQTRLEKNVFNRFLGGQSLKKFEELTGKKYGQQGVLKFNLGEGLNSLIKSKLLSLKEKKENEKVINNIVTKRLTMVAESVKKQKNVDKMSLELFSEISQLNNQGLVTENFGENLKTIFGAELSSMPKTFFENIFDKILSKINMNDASLKRALIMISEKNPTEAVMAFKDCDSLSTMIAKSIAETLYMNVSSEKGTTGQGLNLIKGLLGQEIKKDEFVQKIKNSISGSVCEEFTKLVSNSEKLLNKIKGSSTDDLSVKL